METTSFDQPSTRPPVRLETARLTLRPFEERDLEPFLTYRNDPEVSRYQGWSEPYTREMAVDFVHWMSTLQPGEPGAHYQIALERKAAPGLIGDLMFYRLKRDPRQAEIGFTLAREFQGQGYAAEALTCLLEYLFSEFQLHRVCANCDPENLTSARLMERVGMRREGLFVESIWFKGRWGDELWYAILRREWEQRRLEH